MSWTLDLWRRRENLWLQGSTDWRESFANFQPHDWQRVAFSSYDSHPAASLIISTYNILRSFLRHRLLMTLRECWQSSSLQARLLCLTSSASFLNVDTGYYTDRSEFEQRVEEDATAFKPCGELIYSYTRPAPIKGKGKGVATCALATEDDIVYEVYHVIFFLVPCSYSFTDPDLRLRGIPQAFVHTIGGCNYLYYSMSRQARISLRMRILGNLLFCESWFFYLFRAHSHPQQVRKEKTFWVRYINLSFHRLFFIIRVLPFPREN